MAKGDRQPAHTWVTRSIRLPEDVTLDLYTNPYRAAYAFLHKSGEYLRVGTNARNAVPVIEGTWPAALLYAIQNDAAYIVNFKEKRVFFRIDHPGRAPVWMPAAPILHLSIEKFNHAEAVPYEPFADGTQPKRKHASGASKRKRERS